MLARPDLGSFLSLLRGVGRSAPTDLKPRGLQLHRITTAQFLNLNRSSTKETKKKSCTEIPLPCVVKENIVDAPILIMQLTFHSSFFSFDGNLTMCVDRPWSEIEDFGRLRGLRNLLELLQELFLLLGDVLRNLHLGDLL